MISVPGFLKKKKLSYLIIPLAVDSCYFTSKRVHPSMNRFTLKSHSFNFSWKQKVFFLIGLLYENAVIFSKKLDSLVCLKFVALWILTKPLNKTCLCVSSRGLSIGFTVQRKYFCLLSRFADQCCFSLWNWNYPINLISSCGLWLTHKLKTKKK